jgi:glycosyltransferase involved in cell wall biosynthesis
MRIVVATSTLPFVMGGGRQISRDLAAALAFAGHEVETIEIPFHSDPETMLDQMTAMRLFDVSAAGDLLIAIRTPSQLLDHPNKVLWFIHHERLAYDLWGTKYHGFPATHDSPRIRRAVVAADNAAFRSARRVFTNSEVVRRRVKEFNDFDADVLYPPLGDPSGYRCESYGDFVFYPSRLAPIKRQDILIEAMARVETDVRLVLAGAAEAGSGEDARLRYLIEKHHLADRVELHSNWISDRQKRDLFATALVGTYPAFDEDSYGYTTLESCHSGKGIVTCTDSGGTLELVRDGIEGVVVAPDPSELAAAFDALYSDRERARQMGEAARRRLTDLGISWDNVIKHLVA